MPFLHLGNALSQKVNTPNAIQYQHASEVTPQFLRFLYSLFFLQADNL